jgi:hypothetical protein
MDTKSKYFGHVCLFLTEDHNLDIYAEDVEVAIEFYKKNIFLCHLFQILFWGKSTDQHNDDN